MENLKIAYFFIELFSYFIVISISKNINVFKINIISNYMFNISKKES